MRQKIDKSRRLTRPQQHMDLLGHKDRGVHGAALCRRRLLETRQGKAVIVSLEAEQLPIMPLLEDRLRDVWERLAGGMGIAKLRTVRAGVTTLAWPEGIDHMDYPM